MVLVDPSIWVEVFRRPSPLELTSHVELEEIPTCLPVVQEVLQRFRSQRAFDVAEESMLAMPIVESPLPESLFLDAAALYRVARRRGLTIRSSVDCLIAACAIRHGLEVLHRGRDFSAPVRSLVTSRAFTLVVSRAILNQALSLITFVTEGSRT